MKAQTSLGLLFLFLTCILHHLKAQVNSTRVLYTFGPAWYIIRGMGSVREEYMKTMTRSEALWEDGMYGYEQENVLTNDHCFDCENLIDDCECEGDEDE